MFIRFLFVAIMMSSAVALCQAQSDSIQAQKLQEVTVTGQSARQRVADGMLGSERLELSKLAATPQLFGETDIIKSITLLPGVHGEADEPAALRSEAAMRIRI